MASIIPVSQMIQHPDILGAAQQGLKFGQQQRELRETRADQQQLRSLAPGIMRGDPGAFSQAAAIDPAAASKQLEAGDLIARRAEPLIKLLKEADSVDPQRAQVLWQTHGVPFVRQFSEGTEPTTDWAQAKPMLANLEARIAMAKAGAETEAPMGFRELDMKARAAGLVPGTAEYKQAMNIALGREGRAATGGFGFEKVTGADGRERMGRTNPRTGVFEVYDEASGDFTPMGGAATLNGGANTPAQQGEAVSASAGGGALDPRRDFATLAQSFPGVQVSSLRRSQEKNESVGGVANSYHVTGEAGDFVVPAQQRQAFISRARQMGYEAIDEGDHVHLEPPRRGITSSQFGQGARIIQQNPALAVGPTPYETKFAEESGQQGAQLQYLTQRGGIEAQNAAAKTFAEEQARLGLLPQRNAMEIDTARQKAEAEADIDRTKTARVKAPQLQNVERGLSRIDAALKALDNGLLGDTGPIDQYAQQFTPAGQELTAAVGAIQNDMLALTRVPGVGSQSDLEAKIANLKYPALGNHPEVNRRNLKQLQDFMADMNNSIGGQGQQQTAGQRYSVGQIIETNGKRYRVTGGDSNDPDVEEVR